jgi:hypothetical protein
MAHCYLPAAYKHCTLHVHDPPARHASPESPAHPQVDGNSNLLATASRPTSSTCKPSTAAAPNTQALNSSGLTDLSVTYAAMTPAQRSMTIWKRICPGMMPDTAKTPNTTNADAYAWRPELNDKVDERHHLKKTDFTEYTEAAVKIMNRLKEGKRVGGR